jgi:hypothetical protein
MLETLLQYLTWPAIVLIISLVFLFVFRSKIATLFDRTNKLKMPGGTELDLNEAEVKTIAKEAGKNAALAILKDMQRYGQYMSREQAFATASSWVDNYLEENDKEAVKVEISMMVVGMVYSWRGFLSKIPAWLNSHPTATFEVQVLLADSNFLEGLPICTSAENKWAEESARRIEDIKHMIETLKPNCKHRIKCVVKTYKMLPQYHGIVINRQHLYLGRTDWNFDVPEGSAPELTVGQNRYRYFDRDRDEGADKGKERVGLFLNWHKYFWENYSNEVFSYINNH